MESKPLAGHTALVTGGAKRIGAVLALRLAKAGADVVVHHRSSAGEAAALVEQLRSFGVRATTVAADLAEPGAGSKLFADAARAAGVPITLLVNNASSFPRDTVHDVGLDAVEAAVRTNAWAPFGLLRALHAQGKGGAAVNLLDARIGAPDPKRTSYHLSKVVLRELTLLGARAFAPDVRVNAVLPGPVLPQVDAPSGAPAPTGKNLPLQRPPTPDDIADAVLFLLRAPTVTGALLPVDGGRHLL